MSKFKYLDRPSALPGSCATCGKATDVNGFVDTTLDIDGYGAIQLCYSCIRAMHDTFGFDASARHIINEDAVANVKHLVEVVSDMKDEYESRINALLVHVSGLDSSFVQSYKILAEAAGARERLISEAADRAAESASLSELGLDLD